MAIFRVNIKRLLKDKLNLFLIIILPSIVIALSIAFASSINSPYRIGIVVDKDKSKLAKAIENELKKCFDVVIFDKDRSVVSQMIENDIDCVALLTNKEIDSISAGRKNSIKLYTFGKSEAHIVLKEYLKSLFNLILLQKDVDKNKYLENTLSILKKSPKVTYKNIENNLKNISISFSSGFFVMALLWLSLNASNIILKDFQERVIVRILCSPISKQSYILQSILSIFSITFIQILFFIGLCSIFFGLKVGKNFAVAVLILSICSFMFVAFSIMFISIVNDIKKLSSLNSVVVTIMCMLGGCYWPINIMPTFLQKLSLIFPTTYAVELIRNMLNGIPVYKMLSDILIAIAFCIFFILVGTKQISKNVLSKI